MRFDPFRHHRRSIRLHNYDYAQNGAYFITICTAGRACILGDIQDDKIYLSDFGQIAAEEWKYSAKVRKEVELDEWIIMPNHVHGIVVIAASADGDYRGQEAQPPPGLGRTPSAPTFGPRARSISTFVQGFKAVVTSRIWAVAESGRVASTAARGAPVWQRNYYERIIRNERELNAIREYIVNNPLNWLQDRANPDHP